MKQQPDTLFHSKLENFTKTPPTELWDRIDAGMRRKKQRRVFMSIAASLLIVTMSGYIAYSVYKGDSSAYNRVAQSNAPAETLKKESPVPAVSEGPKKNVPLNPDNVQVPAASEVKANTAKRKKSAENVNDRLLNNSEASNNITQTTSEEPVLPEDTLADEKRFEPETHLAFQGSATRTNVTIVMSEEETREYLMNKNIAEATSEEKKSSTLKRLLKKAADLSTNQDPFGELRQKKNEILALNFKSEKRGQKK
jgi:hypothetical protein